MSQATVSPPKSKSESVLQDQPRRQSTAQSASKSHGTVTQPGNTRNTPEASVMSGHVPLSTGIV